MKKVLILGVNGFIGHHLSQRILETTDWHVYGMDMMSDRITDLLENKAYQTRMHFFEGDITINKEWVEYHVKKCDVILPLVAIKIDATVDRASYYEYKLLSVRFTHTSIDSLKIINNLVTIKWNENIKLYIHPLPVSGN